MSPTYILKLILVLRAVLRTLNAYLLVNEFGGIMEVYDEIPN